MWGLILIGVAVCITAWVTDTLELGLLGLPLILYGIFEGIAEEFKQQE